MGLKNSQYHAIMRKYEQKQLHSHDIQMARYEEVYKKLPEFKTLDDSIASLSIQHGKKLLDGDTSAVDALKKILQNYVIVRFICSNQPASQKIIWSRFTTVRIVKIPDTLVIKNAIVSKKRSLDCFMTSQILKNSL